jgi:hypothetical protein
MHAEGEPDDCGRVLRNLADVSLATSEGSDVAADGIEGRAILLGSDRCENERPFFVGLTDLFDRDERRPASQFVEVFEDG